MRTPCLRSLSFEAKPHLSRGCLAGVEGKAAPSRKRETDCPAVLARHRPTPRPYPVKGAANLSLVRRIRKAGARVVQNSLVIDFPRAVILKTRRYKREGCCFAAVRESVVDAVDGSSTGTRVP
jgi:hypothetical protein